MSARGFSFVKPKIKVGSLKDRRDDFEKLVKHSDRGMAKGQASSGIVLSPEAKAEIKKGVATTLKKTSKLRDEIDEIKGTKKEYKAKGGRVGRKVGGGLGAQSVKYGLDDNYDVTAADPKAKFIAKNKKKKLKKFDSPMAKAVKKKDKKKVIV
jgi:hypothetical protein